MGYFKNAKIGQKVFGLIFGKGVITHYYGNDNYYVLEVTYENGQRVPYTIDGNPSWNFGKDIQTVFYENDIDLFELDIEPVKEILSIKKIIKARVKGKLLVRCDSGIWRNVNECPMTEVERLLEDKQFHRFKI